MMCLAVSLFLIAANSRAGICEDLWSRGFDLEPDVEILTWPAPLNGARFDLEKLTFSLEAKPSDGKISGKFITRYNDRVVSEIDFISYHGSATVEPAGYTIRKELRIEDAVAAHKEQLASFDASEGKDPGLGSLIFLIAARTIQSRYGFTLQSDYVARPPEGLVSPASLAIWSFLQSRGYSEFTGSNFRMTSKAYSKSASSLAPYLERVTIEARPI